MEAPCLQAVRVWGGGGGTRKKQTYHNTGFICDNLEHVCYRNVAQALGYCQRCGSILGKMAERARSDEGMEPGRRACPLSRDQAHVLFVIQGFRGTGCTLEPRARPLHICELRRALDVRQRAGEGKAGILSICSAAAENLEMRAGKSCQDKPNTSKREPTGKECMRKTPHAIFGT